MTNDLSAFERLLAELHPDDLALLTPAERAELDQLLRVDSQDTMAILATIPLTVRKQWLAAWKQQPTATFDELDLPAELRMQITATYQLGRWVGPPEPQREPLQPTDFVTPPAQPTSPVPPSDSGSAAPASPPEAPPTVTPDDKQERPPRLSVTEFPEWCWKPLPRYRRF